MVATDGMVEDVKVTNDLESAKFTKDTDAVDIVQPTAKLIGLTKEQLELYRNDPFWKAIRYSLFVAFWLVWLAMFVGAILIVVLSPKCHQVNWTEKMVAYKVFTLAYSDSKNGIGDFATVGKKLEDLKNIGVSAIWPTPVLKYYKNALGPEAIEKLEVSDQLGGVDAFKELVKQAHAKSIKIIVDLPLTVHAKANWAQNTTGVKNGVALVNLNNTKVREELLNAVKRFLDYGVDGLAITDFGIFNSYTHLDTIVKDIRTLPNAEKLAIYSHESLNGTSDYYKISPLVGDAPSGEGLNGLKKRLEESIKHTEKQEKDGEARVWHLGSMDPSGHRLDQLLGKEPKSNDMKQRISSLFTSAHLFLPKPSIILYGEELGLLSGKPSQNKMTNRIVYPWNNDTFGKPGNQSQGFFVLPERTKNGDFESQKNDPNSPLSLFKALTQLRENPNFMTGKLSHLSFDDLDIYVVQRFPSEDGYFVLVANWSDKEKAFDGKMLPKELQNRKLGAVKVGASTDVVGKDGKVNLELGATPIGLKPYGSMLLDMA